MKKSIKKLLAEFFEAKDASWDADVAFREAKKRLIIYCKKNKVPPTALVQIGDTYYVIAHYDIEHHCKPPKYYLSFYEATLIE